MFIVGELINASRKSIGAAIENQDKEALQQIAVEQYENGADYIDANAGVFVGREETVELLLAALLAVGGTAAVAYKIGKNDIVYKLCA